MRDTIENEHSGKFIDWHLKLWGESLDPAKAVLLPMPEETDDDNHDDISTTTISASTHSATPIPTPTSMPAVPSDHPDRPINVKPSEGTNQDEAKPTITSPSTPSSTASSAASASATGTHTSWLPSFFPTFGVSARTQIWIYGALGLMVVFCSGLGIYFYIARRKRIRNNPRDEWEFDLLEEDEAEGLNGEGGKGKGRRKRRAGELYNAFAADSDEEAFSDDDEEGEEGYRDDGEKHVGDEDDDNDEKGDRGKLLGGEERRAS